MDGPKLGPFADPDRVGDQSGYHHAEQIMRIDSEAGGMTKRQARRLRDGMTSELANKLQASDWRD